MSDTVPLASDTPPVAAGAQSSGFSGRRADSRPALRADLRTLRKFGSGNQVKNAHRDYRPLSLVLRTPCELEFVPRKEHRAAPHSRQKPLPDRSSVPAEMER